MNRVVVLDELYKMRSSFDNAEFGDQRGKKGGKRPRIGKDLHVGSSGNDAGPTIPHF